MQSFRVAAAVAVFTMFAVTGCETGKRHQDEAAIAQAKVLAAQSGVAQQVVWSDIAGNVFKVVVQPPLPGHADQAITRTVGKQPGDARVFAPVTNTPQSPVITPVPTGTKSNAGGSQ